MQEFCVINCGSWSKWGVCCLIQGKNMFQSSLKLVVIWRDHSVSEGIIQCLHCAVSLFLFLSAEDKLLHFTEASGPFWPMMFCVMCETANYVVGRVPTYRLNSPFHLPIAQLLHLSVGLIAFMPMLFDDEGLSGCCRKLFMRFFKWFTIEYKCCESGPSIMYVPA